MVVLLLTGKICLSRGPPGTVVPGPPRDIVPGRLGASRAPSGTIVPGPPRDGLGHLSRDPPGTPRDTPRDTVPGPPRDSGFQCFECVCGSGLSCFLRVLLSFREFARKPKYERLRQTRAFSLLFCAVLCQAFVFY